MEEEKEKLDTHLLSARVIAEYKEAYKVKNEEGEFLAKITGKQIFEATGREIIRLWATLF